MEMGLLTGRWARVALLGCCIAGGLAWTGCASSPERGSAGGEIDPGLLRLTDMDARAHDLGSEIEAGHAVALVFWSPWCEGCREEAPRISAASKEQGMGIRFYGVIPGPDEVVSDDEVRHTAARFTYDFPQVRDRDLALTRGFDVSGTPTIIVLGPGPAVRYQGHVPPEDWVAVAGGGARR